MPTLRLITIGFSHFCEKARWALDRAGLDYEEDDHVPLLHWRASLSAGGRRTVPVLVTPGGVIPESTQILEYADRHTPAERRLFPADPALRVEVDGLVADFDRRLGPAVRRWLYFHVLPRADVAVELLTCTGPRWERRVARSTFPLMRAAMRRGLQISPEASERSRERLEACFAAVDERLADGRRFLVGDRFSAADLTFAALGGVLVGPENRGWPIPDTAQREIPAIAAAVAAARARPAGRFIERLYAEERPPVRDRRRAA
jgi:glutathione S-transferase